MADSPEPRVEHAKQYVQAVYGYGDTVQLYGRRVSSRPTFFSLFQDALNDTPQTSSLLQQLTIALIAEDDLQFSAAMSTYECLSMEQSSRLLIMFSF